MRNWTSQVDLKGKYKRYVFDFWCDFLYRRFQGVFKFTLPETWDEDYLSEVLFFNKGYLIVFDSKTFGVIPQEGDLLGENIYHKPYKARVIKEISNGDDFISIDFSGLIGEDCVVLHPFSNNDTFFRNVIIEFAHRLSLMITSLDVSILNEKMAYFFTAKDKSASETIKCALDQIYNGNPAIVVDKQIVQNYGSEESPFEFIQFNPQNAYLSDKILADFDTVLRQFDSIIGLPTVPNKKERLISSEVNNMRVNSLSVSSRVVEDLQKQFDKVKALFPEIKELKVELRGDLINESYNDGLPQSKS